MRIIITLILLVSLCMIGQRLVVSGGHVLADHRATIEAVDAQLTR